MKLNRRQFLTSLGAALLAPKAALAELSHGASDLTPQERDVVAEVMGLRQKQWLGWSQELADDAALDLLWDTLIANPPYYPNVRAALVSVRSVGRTIEDIQVTSTDWRGLIGEPFTITVSGLYTSDPGIPCRPISLMPPLMSTLIS